MGPGTALEGLPADLLLPLLLLLLLLLLLMLLLLLLHLLAGGAESFLEGCWSGHQLCCENMIQLYFIFR